MGQQDEEIWWKTEEKNVEDFFQVKECWMRCSHADDLIVPLAPFVALCFQLFPTVFFFTPPLNQL